MTHANTRALAVKYIRARLLWGFRDSSTHWYFLRGTNTSSIKRVKSQGRIAWLCAISFVHCKECWRVANVPQLCIVDARLCARSIDEVRICAVLMRPYEEMVDSFNLDSLYCRNRIIW